MRALQRARTALLSRLGSNPPHVRDLGAVMVRRLCCSNVRCSTEWVVIDRPRGAAEQARSIATPDGARPHNAAFDEAFDPARVRCPKCGTKKPIWLEDAFRAVADVNMRAGVLRYQRVDDQGEPEGEPEFVPWSL